MSYWAVRRTELFAKAESQRMIDINGSLANMASQFERDWRD